MKIWLSFFLNMFNYNKVGFMKRVWFIVILFLNIYVANSQQTLFINELMAKNDSYIEDDKGKFSDWLEIYNSSNTDVNIGGYYLTDDMDTPELHAEQHDWQAHQNSQLKVALEELDERSRDIISKRWLTENKTTLQDLAEKYQVSAERVRQLENNAIKKLKQVVVAA